MARIFIWGSFDGSQIICSLKLTIKDFMPIQEILSPSDGRGHTTSHIYIIEWW